MEKPAPLPDWSAQLALSIDRTAPTKLYRQLLDELRRAILGGAAPPRSRLPPTRDLAARLGVSRTCVVGVYEQLVAEGYAEGRVGAGTFVAEHMAPPTAAATPALAPRPAARPSPVARYARLVPDQAQFATAAFNTGRCAVDERTMAVWRKLHAAALRRFDPAWLGYGDPRGAPRLRAAVAQYLRASRGVACDPEQIMILAGTQQAMHLVIRVLVEPGDAVWIEDPTYPALHAALTAARARVVPVPVDTEGLVVARGIAAAPVARAVYVTPSHQSPSGVVLSMGRRLELLAWAQEARAWVIEDDYDSEFRYAGPPLASLQGIDGGARVIYLGTFSKVLFPGLRLGYAVVPWELLDALTAARFLADRHPPGLTEAVMTAFIEQGHFAAHLRRMSARYRAGRDLLVAEVRARLGGALEAAAPDQGMTLLARLAPGMSDLAVARAAAARGVVVRPLSPLFVAAPAVQALMLGFTGHDAAALRAGTVALERCLAAGADGQD